MNTQELIEMVQGVCCPRVHGCELNDADECPAQAVRIALEASAQALTTSQEREGVLRGALIRLRDCDFVITPRDRMDAVRDIARQALQSTEQQG